MDRPTASTAAPRDTPEARRRALPRWAAQRPRTLVLACSDGRLDEAVDAFLTLKLGVAQYDRLYVPGGPGALASGAFEFQRAQQQRRELAFLLTAHQVAQVVLLFHGASPDGPEEADCADYRRKLPGRGRAELERQQRRDAREVAGLCGAVEVLAFRLEVGATLEPRLVALPL